jgi:hypothetical protein
LIARGNNGQKIFLRESDYQVFIERLRTVRKLAPSLLKSSYVTEKMLEEFYARYHDPHYWTSVITFTANWERKPA